MKRDCVLYGDHSKVNVCGFRYSGGTFMPLQANVTLIEEMTLRYTEVEIPPYSDEIERDNQVKLDSEENG